MPEEQEPKVVRIIPALSIETGAIIARLRECKPGDVVTYDELSKILGKNVRIHRTALSTARKRVEVDDRLIFETVARVGVKCLTVPEAALTMATHVKRTRSAARRGVRKARAIDILQVPQEARSGLVAAASYLALVDGAGAPRSQKRLEAEIQTQKTTAFLPLQRALEALREA